MANALAHREEFVTIAALSQPLHNWIESIQEEILSYFILQALQKNNSRRRSSGVVGVQGRAIFFQELHFSQG